MTPPTPEAVFAQVDGNSDGIVTLDEFEAVAHSPRMLRMLDQAFAEWDVDGSDSLDIDEFTSGATA